MLSQQHIIQDLRCSLAASEATIKSMLDFVEPGYPLLASLLRCKRVKEECQQLIRARQQAIEDAEEQDRMWRERCDFARELAELRSRVEKISNSEFRGSVRSMAAENAKLNIMRLESSKYIKNVCVECYSSHALDGTKVREELCVSRKQIGSSKLSDQRGVAVERRMSAGAGDREVDDTETVRRVCEG